MLITLLPLVLRNLYFIPPPPSFCIIRFTRAMSFQVKDFSPQREPHKSHYFLAGVGITHIFVCIFFTLAIVLFRYAIPGTNILEVNTSLQLDMLLVLICFNVR